MTEVKLGFPAWKSVAAAKRDTNLCPNVQRSETNRGSQHGGVCPTARRQIEARQICRLPQLQLPVVHAIGSPQVAASFGFVLPSYLILDGVSTPTDTHRGIAP